MIHAENFISACISHEYTFFTGVPCSFLKPLINYVIQSEDLSYITATSEGEAVAIASGAYLAGRKAVVICQNSGLGNMVNPLTSLNFPFRIPILLIITLRGEPGLNDEPQHELMGQITGKLLDTLQIGWAFFPDELEMVNPILDQAQNEMASSGRPFALIMKKGNVAQFDLKIGAPLSPDKLKATPKGHFYIKPSERMSRMESIKIVCETISGKDAIIATTGKTGRELFTLRDSENHLYVIGSMGCASGIGFGVQYVRPQQRIVVLDGDGAVLMKMGTLSTIGYYKPKRFIHIILDNEMYESTGGQQSVSPLVDFCKVASACGYQQCFRADTKSDLINAINSAIKLCEPTLIHVKVSACSNPDLGRPKLKPYQIKERFMAFINHGV